jgi:hypothetical protein
MEMKYVIVSLKSWTESRGGHNYLQRKMNFPAILRNHASDERFRKGQEGDYVCRYGFEMLPG